MNLIFGLSLYIRNCGYFGLLALLVLRMGVFFGLVVAVVFAP